MLIPINILEIESDMSREYNTSQERDSMLKEIHTPSISYRDIYKPIDSEEELLSSNCAIIRPVEQIEGYCTKTITLNPLIKKQYSEKANSTIVSISHKNKIGDIKGSMYQVYLDFMEYKRCENWYACDEILDLLDTDIFDVRILISLLSASYSIRHRLNMRTELYNNTYKRLCQLYPEEEVQEILNGLL